MPPPGKLLERLGILHERHLALGSSCKALQGRDTGSWANFRDRCMSGRSLGLVGSPVLGRVRSPALGPRVGSGLPTRSTGLVCSPPGSPGWVGSLALGPRGRSGPWPRSLGWVRSLAPGRQVRLGPRPRSLGGVRSPAQVPRCGQVPGPGPHVGSGPRPWIPGSGWVGFPAQAPGGVVSPAQSPGRVSSLALGPQIRSSPRPRSPGRVGSPALGPRVGSGRVLGPGSPGRVRSLAWVPGSGRDPCPGSTGHVGSPDRVPCSGARGALCRHLLVERGYCRQPGAAHAPWRPRPPSAAFSWWDRGTAGGRVSRVRGTYYFVVFIVV